jgi:hypothetical protein
MKRNNYLIKTQIDKNISPKFPTVNHMKINIIAALATKNMKCLKKMKRLMKILSINLEKLWDILKQTILAIEEE